MAIELNEEQKQAAQWEITTRAEAAIRILIGGYQCCARGRVNHGRTETVRRELSQLEVKVGGKRDSVLTLGLVQEALKNIES